MHGLSRKRSILLLPLLACACQSAGIVRLPRQHSGALPTPSWVVVAGGTRVPVESGRFTPDSIIGTLAGGNRFAVSRDSVWFVEERRVSATKSIRAVGMGVGLLAGALALLISATLPGN